MSPDLWNFPGEEVFFRVCQIKIFLNCIFGPSMVKYNILSNKGRSKRHAVMDCLFFFFFSSDWINSLCELDKKTNANLTFVYILCLEWASIKFSILILLVNVTVCLFLGILSTTNHKVFRSFLPHSLCLPSRFILQAKYFFIYCRAKDCPRRRRWGTMNKYRT